MSSKALSKHSCVRKGASYDEMYQLGQGDLDVPYPKRDPSANLPSEEEDKDSDEDGSDESES